MALFIFFHVACGPLEPSGKRADQNEPREVNQETPENTGIIELSIHIESHKKNDLFSQKVSPILEASCLTGACHSQAIDINLEAYPFEIEGSYTEEKIKADLGPTYELMKVQSKVVEELIRAMEISYMPPPILDPVDDKKIQMFRDWLDQGLPMMNINLSLMLNAGPNCQFKFSIRDVKTTQMLDLGSCEQPNDIIRYRLQGEHGETLLRGHFTAKQEKARISY